MNGQYTEKLESGGELIVTLNDWEIRYYFQGPDLRYNGTFVYIEGKKIDNYIQAWKNNYSKYLQLKETNSDIEKVEIAGEMGMTIRLGWSEGVCIRSYHMPINSKGKLEKVVKDYENAKVRAKKIQNVLQTL